MRLYSGTSKQFIQDSVHNQIAEKLKLAFFNYFRFNPSPGEVNSWRNSLRSMSQVFQYANLLDHGVILEYQLPLTSKRLDCMVCGKDDSRHANAVIVELKQWDKCEEADGANEVLTWLGGAKREVLHPSVQVGQYKMYLEDTHTAFYDESHPVILNACTYLHNYNYYDQDVLWSHKFRDTIDRYPLFTADDVERLKEYLIDKLSHGEGIDVLRRIEESKYRPSKKLMDHVGGIIKGKPEYILLDEQLIVYDAVLTQARKGFHDKQNTVIVIKGGPGTGKSVIAINLMADLLLGGYNTHYVTGSRAFTQTLRKIIGTRGSAQFKYFNSYARAENNAIDVLIADESHRLRTTSDGRFTPRAQRSNTPQIEELLKASKVSVFFIDDKQIVRPNEIGSSEYIKRHSLEKNCKVLEYQLEAQFRCNGSDAFVNWVNNTLGIERTANVLWGQNEEFDFRIYPTPISLENAIREKSAAGHTARLTAGFCWKWSLPNADGTLKDDVVIGDYRRPWDAKPEARKLAPGIPPASLWAYDPNGINQIGCIYTAQGFEFDYVGVIFGEDLVYDFDAQQWVGVREKSADNVVKRSRDQFTDLVKNTYRVLLSRGMKGCYVCFLDKDTERFFRSRIETTEQFRAKQPPPVGRDVRVEQQQAPLPPKNTNGIQKLANSLPIYSLKAAAGKFLENQDIHEEGWIEVDMGRKLDEKMFVARVVGDSMEPDIPNGSYCIFRAEPVGSRQGKIVLVCHQDIHDVDNGGAYTVKKYWSKKAFEPDGTWRHEKIVLESLNKAYEPIIIAGASEEEFRIVAEFLCVLKP
jgi:SOS-response transcriptional repressor LexA